MTTMRNRKAVITAFLLVACLLIGVGYAVASDNFQVTGNITISEQGATDAFNEDIRFAGIVKTGSDTPASDVLASEGLGYTASCNVPMDTASFHVTGLKGAGDSQTVTFRVQNYGDVAATLNFTTDPEFDNDAFDVTHNLVNGVSLPVSGYVDITFTVSCISSVVEQTSSTFTFGFIANPVTGTP